MDEGEKELADDEAAPKSMGLAPERARPLSGFSSFASSLSIPCIPAGGIASFQAGFCSVGGASIGLSWPLAGRFSLTVAPAMGLVASPSPAPATVRSSAKPW
jgi:hypothetical protein